ncbi:hypothetical protein H2248_006543 [Termitomyces sp. 'cryptogamus']|nr:hypothetical protein H2248_006543 [Termitomyces sp. 'cryptogamus']
MGVLGERIYFIQAFSNEPGQFNPDGSRRKPDPSFMHGFYAKWRGTFSGNEDLRNKEMRDATKFKRDQARRKREARKAEGRIGRPMSSLVHLLRGRRLAILGEHVLQWYREQAMLVELGHVILNPANHVHITPLGLVSHENIALGDPVGVSGSSGSRLSLEFPRRKVMSNL